MTTRNIYDLAQTWNDGATTFTAIKMNVTDTASASGSLLMDLQVGGTSQLSVEKGGSLRAMSIRGLSANLVITGDQSISLVRSTTGFYISNTYCVFPNNREVRFTTSDNVASSGFVSLRSDGSNVLAQRNLANAQAFNIYNTYTDASNYERGFMRWSGNVLEIGTEKAGTGVTRYIDLKTAPDSGIKYGPADGRDIILYSALCSLQLDVSASNFFPNIPVDLGRLASPWRDIFLRPSASLTPSANGDLCIEATNNTTLTFKYKGSDGTVRSGTVTLA
jgi:hypothetical protein